MVGGVPGGVGVVVMVLVLGLSVGGTIFGVMMVGGSAGGCG